jgi:hypothetical protein
VTSPFYISLAAMGSDPLSDGDGKCFTVQLDGSDNFPRAQKVISTPLHLSVGIDQGIDDLTRQFSDRHSQ